MSEFFKKRGGWEGGCVRMKTRIKRIPPVGPNGGKLQG